MKSDVVMDDDGVKMTKNDTTKAMNDAREAWCQFDWVEV